MRRLLIPALVLAALIVGVVNAGARSSATTTITVNVMGVGTVTSSPSGIKCGNGNTKCSAAFADTGTLTLSAKAASGWDPGNWDTSPPNTDCAGSTSTACDITLDGADHIATAVFNPKSGTTQSTLSVTVSGEFDDTTGAFLSGDVSDANGSILCGVSGSACQETVVKGSTVTLSQSTQPGYVFRSWGGPCSGAGLTCTVEMDGDQTVSAAWVNATDTSQLTVNIAGGGKVKGGGIDCPSKCTASETTNSAVTLNASPNSGYVFTGWAGGCAGTTPTCTVTMTTDTTVTATFAQSNVLSVAISGNGSVTGGSGAINCGGGATICAANFASGATVSLVASPASGATFLGWTGACGGTATTCTVAMNQSKNVTATFSGGTGGTGFTLTVSVAGNGTVTGTGINCGAGATTCTSPNHAAGSTMTLTATPAAGATFTGWSGACSGTATNCTVTFDASKTVTASFSGGAAGTFPLNVSVSGPGRVTGASINCGNGASTCSATFSSGTTVTLTATPGSAATFGGWGGACAGTTPKCTVSMTAAKSVSATFTAAGTPGTLTINVVGRGSVSTSAGACASTGRAKTCVQHFKAGATTRLTARPAAGQAFLGWAGACSGKLATCTVKLSKALAATATFTNRTPRTATLASLGPPIVRKTTSGYRVTLRFQTTVGGTARVRAVRAGRMVTSVAAKVAAGRVRLGPFPVPLSGLYTFEIRLAGNLLRMPACLGRCGAAAPPPPFLLVRQAPAVTRSGDVWSVTLHVRANQIYDGRIRASRGGRVLVNQHFLGRAGRVAFGPFLLGPGNYTLRLAAVDAYGRVRTLSWIVSLR
jgi:uncharacterized repeat protein (TIGR02543 family)